MDAAFTAEQHEIRRTLRELLARSGGPDAIPAAVRTAEGYDPALWRRLAGGLGLPGLALAEEYGGAGCTVTELALACEETGRALLPTPLLATAVLAAPLIDALGTPDQRAALLPRIAAGTLTAALAVPGGSLATALGLTGDNADGAWAGGGRAGGIQARGPGEDGGRRLYGEADRVLDGHSAHLLLVAAHAGGYPRSRTQLFLVDAGAAGLARTRLTALDETRPLARVELRDTPAELLGADADADATAALTAAGRAAAAILAAEAVGTAASALERTVEYVKAREQFGRAVGSFQAVKHRLADLYVRVEAARSAAYHAARDPEAGPLALAQALEAAGITTGEAVQLHGGIGFTWEHEAHRYLKRAAGDELLFGPVHRLRDHAARRAGLFGAAAAFRQPAATASRPSAGLAYGAGV
ncbi:MULTISPECIES: acyl-CoA dehydrogenase family protein [Streptomyces]|uniref:Acyl-CoA dehydrogenase n=1 Tax=Streptomyces griseus subsp. griseus (strain JCM 4626 / CBS 651.72 / NBRC 13350 / KCC S-0626 / ISP 5235) TaxID=455632 RepID=B1W559_STRGG|nr:acyl-CoA dehydrogenase family protein [Streptomyces griseus]BAG19853.1 putative acyl-CoA dehydrogenase [Streptomyces griseus subsp. griseus NBRC 13350]SEE86321.1 Acyl-CoA dehydrogenase [Streptomyces griseus]SQA23461.1 acyl-CoA dehydrogenase [Streptomyces griseus]